MQRQMIFLNFSATEEESKEKSMFGVSMGLSPKQGPSVKTRLFVINKKGKGLAFPFYKQFVLSNNHKSSCSYLISRTHSNNIIT